jgi:hypothetical protein
MWLRAASTPRNLSPLRWLGMRRRRWWSRERNAGDASMIHHAHFKSFGDGAYLTTIMGGGSRFHPRFAGHNPEDDLFHMDGPAVLRMVRGIA